MDWTGEISSKKISPGALQVNVSGVRLEALPPPIQSTLRHPRVTLKLEYEERKVSIQDCERL